MKHPKQTNSVKRNLSSVSRTNSASRLSVSTIERINESYHFAYMSESREVDRMSSIFCSHKKK